MFRHPSFKRIVVRSMLAAIVASWCAASHAQSWPQPVPGAQRAVVKYREGLFGRVHYKSRYGMGISDNGVMFFHDLFNTAGTLVPIVLKQRPSGSGSGGSGGSGDGSGIPADSGGEGRSAALERSAAALEDDEQKLKETEALRKEFEALRDELIRERTPQTDPPPRIAPAGDEGAAPPLPPAPAPPDGAAGPTELPRGQ